LAALLGAGYGGQAAADPAGKHRPEDTGDKEQHGWPDHHCDWQEQCCGAEQHPVEDGGEGNHFAPVTGRIEASGNEGAE
jgi:hypothetical protein